MQQQKHTQHLNLVGYAVPSYDVTTRSKIDYTVPLAISISVTLCFCPVLGLIALVTAVIGMTREPDSYSLTIRNASLYLSLAGYLCGVVLIGIILIVGFAHKGSEIYIRPPWEVQGKYWQSQA